MKLQIIAPALLIFLGACSQTPIGSGGFSVPVYSKEQRQKVHDELASGKCNASLEFIKDYKVLRDQVRVK